MAAKRASHPTLRPASASATLYAVMLTLIRSPSPCLPLSAAGLPAAAQQKPAQALPATVEGVPTAKIIAIGIGVVLGAVASEAVIAGDGVALLGGALGGVVAAWWYDGASAGASRAARRAIPTPRMGC